jgi:hypothetical protein
LKEYLKHSRPVFICHLNRCLQIKEQLSQSRNKLFEVVLTCGVFNFPKKQRKNLISALEFKKWLNQTIKGLFHANYVK